MKHLLLITALVLMANVLFAQKNYYKITVDSVNVKLSNDTIITLSKGQIYESPKDNTIILFGDTIPLPSNSVEKEEKVQPLSPETIAYLQNQSKYLDIPTFSFHFEELKNSNGGHNILLIFEKGKYEKDPLNRKNGIEFDLNKTVKNNFDSNNKDIRYFRIISGINTPVFCLSPFSTKTPPIVEGNQSILTANENPDKVPESPISFMDKIKTGIKDYGIPILVLVLMLIASAYYLIYRKNHKKDNTIPASGANATPDKERKGNETDVSDPTGTAQPTSPQITVDPKNLENIVENIVQKHAQKIMDRLPKNDGVLHAEIDRLKKENDKIAPLENELQEKTQHINQLNKQLELAQPKGIYYWENYQEYQKTNTRFLETLIGIENELVIETQKHSNEKTADLINLYLARFYNEKPQKKLGEWEVMLHTLEYNGLIVHEIKNSVKAEKSDEIRTRILTEAIFSELYRNYLNALLILAEELRSANQIMPELDFKNFAQQKIETLLTLSKTNGIEIYYVKLYENITDFSKVEVKEEFNQHSILREKVISLTVDLPDPILDIVKYAVNYGDITDKTKVYSIRK